MDNWANVAKHVAQRWPTRYKSIRELYEASGVSPKTWENLLDGKPIRRDRWNSITKGLGWTPESFNAMLAGKAPSESRTTPVDARELVRQLEVILSQLGQALEESQ